MDYFLTSNEKPAQSNERPHGAVVVLSCAPHPSDCTPVETSLLNGASMNWAVACCLGFEHFTFHPNTGSVTTRLANGLVHFHAYDEAGMGGTIAAREGISLVRNHDVKANEEGAWYASVERDVTSTHGRFYGASPMVAAMRCFVASRRGQRIQVPRELLELAEHAHRSVVGTLAAA